MDEIFQPVSQKKTKMITLLILIVNMWWTMFTGNGFVHGDTAAYLGASIAISFIEIMIIATILLNKTGK